MRYGSCRWTPLTDRFCRKTHLFAGTVSPQKEKVRLAMISPSNKLRRNRIFAEMCCIPCCCFFAGCLAGTEALDPRAVPEKKRSFLHTIPFRSVCWRLRRLCESSTRCAQCVTVRQGVQIAGYQHGEERRKQIIYKISRLLQRGFDCGCGLSVIRSDWSAGSGVCRSIASLDSNWIRNACVK